MAGPLAASAEPDHPAASPLILAAVLAGWVAGIFAAAGTVAWPEGWVTLGATAVAAAWHRAHVGARQPALLARRARVGAGTTRWDVAWLAVFWPLALAVPVVGGLEVVRLGRAPLPGWTMAAGLVVLVAGVALSARAMVANPFFEGTVRLQPDQRVVDGGPYRRVRHPGYAGLGMWVVGAALLTRSAGGVTLGLVAAAWIAVRTALEDRFLRRGLPGYQAYADRVRWKLLPGLW